MRYIKIHIIIIIIIIIINPLRNELYVKMHLSVQYVNCYDVDCVNLIT